MPAISPQRTSNPSGYQQPISKLSSKFDKLPISDYTSNSLGKPRGSSPSRFNYLSSTYTNKSYKDGRHYDTNATSSRIGVSSYNNRFNHSISSLDRANSIQRERNSIIIDNNDSIDNTVYKTLLKKYSNTLQSKPPLIGGNRNCSLSQSRTNNNQHRHNNTKLNSTNNDQFNTQLSKSSSFDHVFNYSKKSDHNSKDFNNFEHNQLSSSSLARYVATSGSELYNKYSPAHYIPKCELSRSRSLSEATTTPSSLPTSLNNLISNDKYKNTNISNGNVSEQKLYLNNNDNNSSSSNDQQQLENCLLDDSVTLRDLKISSNNSSTTSSTRDTTDLNSSQLTNHKTKQTEVKVKNNSHQEKSSITYKKPTKGKTSSLIKDSDITKLHFVNVQFKSNDNNNNNKSFIDNNGRRLITPLVHKSNLNTNYKQQKTTNKSKIMNCTQNNTDDIEYIDSEDLPHENHRIRHNSTQRPRPKSSILSSSNTNLITNSFDKVDNLQFKTIGTNNLTSTFPLLVKPKTNYLCNDLYTNNTSGSNGIKSTLIKNNNLSEIKRNQTRSSTGNLYSYNYSSTAKSLNGSSINYKRNNESLSPTISPQPQRRSNNIHNSSAILKANNHQLTNNKTEIPSSHKSTVTNNSTQKYTKTLIPTSSSNKLNDNNESILVKDKKTKTKTKSKKVKNSDRHTRNDDDNSHENSASRYYTSRSARPPASPTALQWERDSHKSSLTSNRNLSNDNESSYLKNNYSSYATQNSSSDEPIDGLRGLRNIGNTCFMNSVIQCLSHTTELTNFLKSQTNISTSTKDEKILYEFATLIREMWTSNAHSVAPRDLKNAFSSKHRMYSGYNQQDAQEFLRFFLDSLHCALNTGTKGHQLNIDESLSDNKKADLTWEWYSRIENSVIKNLFVGQFKSTLTCTNCGNTSATFDPFWDLSVPLPSSSRCKLDACFEYFIKEEILDGDEMPTCSRCKTRRKSTKSFRIQRFPKYLVIHLKRFSETRWSKLTNIVEFPTCERGLNMGPYGANSSNTYYTLYAISNHMGSTAGGHYVALCKNPVSKQWHEFNDNDVSSIPESSLVSSSAYLLFYEKAS